MSPCDLSDDCMHPVCEICQRLIRAGDKRVVDHPGTIRGLVKARRCMYHRDVTKEITDPHHAYNLRALHRFMARIRGKGWVKV